MSRFLTTFPRQRPDFRTGLRFLFRAPEVPFLEWGKAVKVAFSHSQNSKGHFCLYELCLDKCYRCPNSLTGRQFLKDRATQLLMKYKSGGLVTQKVVCLVLFGWRDDNRFHLIICRRLSLFSGQRCNCHAYFVSWLIFPQIASHLLLQEKISKSIAPTLRIWSFLSFDGAYLKKLTLRKTINSYKFWADSCYTKINLYMRPRPAEHSGGGLVNDPHFYLLINVLCL